MGYLTNTKTTVNKQQRSATEASYIADYMASYNNNTRQHQAHQLPPAPSLHGSTPAVYFQNGNELHSTINPHTTVQCRQAGGQSHRLEPENIHTADQEFQEASPLKVLHHELADPMQTLRLLTQLEGTFTTQEIIVASLTGYDIKTMAAVASLR